MKIDEISIGSKWKDNLGKNLWDEKKIIKRGLTRIVEITNKSSNSIEYKDESGFYSWISVEDFFRIENSNKLVRFELV
jgi:hypothetical protein